MSGPISGLPEFAKVQTPQTSVSVQNAAPAAPAVPTGDQAKLSPKAKAIPLDFLDDLGSLANRVRQIEKFIKYNDILFTTKNLETFIAETSNYRETAIGPESSPEAITDLQGKLARLGFAVQQTGVYDRNTEVAILDFKAQNSLHQRYLDSRGDYAANVFADLETRQCLEKELRRLKK